MSFADEKKKRYVPKALHLRRLPPLQRSHTVAAVPYQTQQDNTTRSHA